MQYPRVVEVLADGDSVGSGYLISPRHVLTARHVAPGNTAHACSVRPLMRAGAEPGASKRPAARTARLAWRSDRQDLAILRVTGRPVAGIEPGPIRFACVP